MPRVSEVLTWLWRAQWCSHRFSPALALAAAVPPAASREIERNSPRCHFMYLLPPVIQGLCVERTRNGAHGCQPKKAQGGQDLGEELGRVVADRFSCPQFELHPRPLERSVEPWSFVPVVVRVASPRTPTRGPAPSLSLNWGKKLIHPRVP
jgi:hypothetical protein